MPTPRFCEMSLDKRISRNGTEMSLNYLYYISFSAVQMTSFEYNDI